MSEPRRYVCTRVLGMFEMQEASNGDWVSVEDYARLKAELRGKVMDSISDIGQLGEQSAEIAHLKAEVERLEHESAKWRRAEHAVGDKCIEFAKIIQTLKAEVERLTNCKSEADRLKAEVERLKMEESKLLTLCETYEGDLERLRKAGDAMERSLAFAYPDSPKIKDWNAAKEGKPS